MSILNTYIHKLVFRIDKDAPKEFVKRWQEFKLKCEGGENKHIVEQIKDYCKLEKNKKLPYLNRSEGGMGGDENLLHKQIRFRHIFMGQKLNGIDISNYNDDDIVFNEIISTDSDKWTYEELDDLIYAFIKTSNYNVEADCVKGYIEMINENAYSDDYLNSDSE